MSARLLRLGADLLLCGQYLALATDLATTRATLRRHCEWIATTSTYGNCPICRPSQQQRMAGLPRLWERMRRLTRCG
jgi:hypothetical protein